MYECVSVLSFGGSVGAAAEMSIRYVAWRMGTSMDGGCVEINNFLGVFLLCNASRKRQSRR